MLRRDGTSCRKLHERPLGDLGGLDIEGLERYVDNRRVTTFANFCLDFIMGLSHDNRKLLLYLQKQLFYLFLE